MSRAVSPLLLDPVFGYLIIIGIALLFAIAGIHKLRDPVAFKEVFAAYRLLPEAWSRRLAWLIPCIELATAIALLVSLTRRSAIVGAVALLLAYASAIAVNIARGRRELDCGCGAAGSRRSIAAWMAWRNGFLVLALGITSLPWSSRVVGASDLLTIGAGSAVLVTLYAAIDRLLGEVAPKAAAWRRRTA